MYTGTTLGKRERRGGGVEGGWRDEGGGGGFTLLKLCIVAYVHVCNYKQQLVLPLICSCTISETSCLWFVW